MTQTGSTPPILQADYFDGHSARARPVRLAVHGRVLHIDADPGADHPEALALRIPVRRISWPERQRHGARQAYLPAHGMLTHADPTAWDAWARDSGVARSWLVPWMQSWRGALAATVLVLASLWGAWHWGVPALGTGIVALLPAEADRQLGDSALDSLDRDWMQPSALPAAEQQAVRDRFAQAVAVAARRPGATPPPAWTLHFRRLPAPGAKGKSASDQPAADKPATNKSSTDKPGIANAMALPGGHIIVSDALVQLLADRPDVLVGVLGHELGHVQHRHGMRLLVQAGLVAAGSAALLGDVSAVLAGVPVLLGQAAYSRRFEFEADDAAARLMRANGSDPASFGILFERLRAARPADQRDAEAPGWAIGLASHPPDAERLRRMADQR